MSECLFCHTPVDEHIEVCDNCVHILEDQGFKASPDKNTPALIGDEHGLITKRLSRSDTTG